MAVEQRPAFIPLPAASAFPPELIALAHWVAYDLEERPTGWTKVPKNPRDGGNASSTNAATWTTFEEARAYAAKRGIGVGFMLAPPLFGFDLDGCITDGEVSPLATSALGEIHTYTELSVSGTGLKGIGYGKKPGARCRRKGLELKIYDHARLFALTGHRLPDAPLAINDCQEGLDFIYGAAFGAEQDAPTVEWDPAAVSNDDDQAIIDWLHDYKHGGRFAAYWAGGGAEDPSGGDQGMANMIAWRTGPDPARIEAIFNASARALRAKWQQRPAYRASTIRKAIDGCAGRFYEARPVFRPQPPRVAASCDASADAAVSDLDPALYEYMGMSHADLARRAYKAERFNKAIIKFDKSRHIKSQKQTVKAVLFLHANRAAQGQLDEEGWVRTSLAELGDIGGVSKDAAGDHLKEITRWEVGIQKQVRKEEYFILDNAGRQIPQERPHLYVKVDGDVVDTLEHLSVFEPPKAIKPDGEEKASWGGKREPCPRCGAQRRRTVVTCADCQLEFSDKITETAPEDNTVADVSERADEPASIPPTPVEELAADPLVAVRDDQHDEADDWDPYQCNHTDHRGEQCTARIDPAIGKRYCWQHQQAPIEPSPVPHGAVAFTLGGVRYGPPRAEAPPLDPAIAESMARQYDGQTIAARLSGFQARWDGGERTEDLILLVAEWRQIAAARRALDAVGQAVG